MTNQEFSSEANEGGYGLRNASVVVRVQSSKSVEVMTATAAVLRRHGLDTESNLLSGKWLTL